MEITPQIDKLIRSKNTDDNRIGLELLRESGFNDMEYIRYHYRYEIGDLIPQFFDHTVLTGNVPALCDDREIITSVNLLKWK